MPTESQFAVYTAPAANGPWTKVIGAAVSTDGNKISFLINGGIGTGANHFIIVQE